VQRIRYYYAPEGAAVYLEPNVFFPIEQTLQFLPTDGVGELTTEARVNYSGASPAGVDGEDAHGTLEDFQGLTPYTGPVPIESVPDCRVPKLIRFLIEARYLSFGPLLPPREFTFAMHGKHTSPPLAPVGVGLSARRNGNGKTLTCRLHGVTNKPGKVVKLEFGVEGKPVFASESKFAFKGDSKSSLHDFEGSLKFAVDRPSLYGNAGKTAFFAEMSNFSFTAGAPGPGDMCTSALAIANNTDYTFTINSGETHWFTWAISAAGPYYAKLTISSGTYPTDEIYFGASCASKSPFASTSSGAPCSSLMFGSATNVFMSVTPTGGASATYTVRQGPGGCPP
jgi:hypothetical protein